MNSLVTICDDGAGNTTQMPNGNLAAPGVVAPTQKLIYNAQGQLAELRDASNVVIATYVYRGDGKRAWKELANGTRSYFYYSGENLIAATNGVDVSSLQLWGADALVGYRSFNSTSSVVSKSYNLYDTQGNLAQSVDAATGNVTSQSAVNAWGEPLRDSAGNASGAGYGAKFGYVRDGESGFYLCTLRYYGASAGRWITRDPIGYAGGSNLYGYVGNDPMNLTDPMGLSPRLGGQGGQIINRSSNGSATALFDTENEPWGKGKKRRVVWLLEVPAGYQTNPFKVDIDYIKTGISCWPWRHLVGNKGGTRATKIYNNPLGGTIGVGPGVPIDSYKIPEWRRLPGPLRAATEGTDPKTGLPQDMLGASPSPFYSMPIEMAIKRGYLVKVPVMKR